MFYTVIQNNSGGYFIDNKDVAQVVIVEANTNYEAQRLLEDITKDYGEYCECCGFRWDLDFGIFGIQEGKEQPCLYDIPIREYLSGNAWYNHIIVYYLNGSKVEYSPDNIEGKLLKVEGEM